MRVVTQRTWSLVPAQRRHCWDDMLISLAQPAAAWRLGLGGGVSVSEFYVRKALARGVIAKGRGDPLPIFQAKPI
jgi:hypothetical protein